MSRGGAEKGGDTELEAGSRLWAVSIEPDTGFEPTNREIMTWTEVGRLTDWATQVPQGLLILFIFLFILGWEGQRKRQTQNPKQAPGSELSAEPNAGLELTNCEIMTWAEVGSLADAPEPTQL